MTAPDTAARTCPELETTNMRSREHDAKSMGRTVSTRRNCEVL